MQCALSFPLLVERIYSNVTRLTVKCLYFPYLSPHYSQLIRTPLGPARPVPPILPAGRALIRSISAVLRNLDLDISAADVPPGPPPVAFINAKGKLNSYIQVGSASPTTAVGPKTRGDSDVLHHSPTPALH